MAANNSTTSLAPDFKIQYAQEMENVVPSAALLQQFKSKNAPGFDGRDPIKGGAVSVPIDWSKIAKLGRYYALPIKSASGQEGVTYIGKNSTGTTLNTPTALVLAEAQIEPYGFSNRQRITYQASSQGDSAGMKAIDTTAEIVINDIKDVAYNRLEQAALWGASTLGAGVIQSQTIASTNLTVIFTVATFCPTWWVANIGANVQFYTLSGTTPTQDMGGLTTSYANVTSVDTANRTVVFQMRIANGTASAWGTSTTVPAAGSVAYMYGEVTSGTDNLTTGSKAMIGLHTQLSATSGTIYNLDRSTLPGQTYDINPGGSAVPLTKAAVIAAAMTCVDKGNIEDMVLLVGTGAWMNLATEDMAGRIWDSSYSGRKSQSGSEELEYKNLNGTIRVVCHPFMKQGYAFLFTPGQVSWIGSADVTFKVDNKELWDFVPNTDTYEIQVFANKSIFLKAPTMGTVLTNIASAA